MTVSQIMQVIKAAMIMLLKVSAPILLVSMAVGLVISILQAATQVHEQTVAFVPKMAAIVIIIIVMGSWMIENMKDFTVYIFDMITKLR
ncbi:MAG: flagellar biosynthesis protein FliQ [Oscillospiraceae bacterium]|mgnify:CR=1 FL=1|nr:flagellar biosynthesis protein FliQ [Oscillospiraceae bacterium]